jgi:hypothetical protein
MSAELPHFDRSALREHAYLVERGVRPLAIIGSVQAIPALMEAAYSEVLKAAVGTYAVPFTMNMGDGTAEYGYAAAPWVLDLYKWTCDSADMPQANKHRIIGLLLGYSVDAIGRFDDRFSGKRCAIAPSVTPTGPSESSADMGETVHRR